MAQTLKQIIDTLQRNVQGGKTSQGSVLDPQYLRGMINSFRATIIKAEFKRTGVIQPSWLQVCYLPFSQNLQFSAPQGAVLFTLPSVISLGDEDGIRYVGSIGGGNQGDPQQQYACVQTWNRVWSRGELSTLNQNSFMKLSNNPDTAYVLYDFTNGRLELYNEPTCTEGRVEAVFADPTQVQNAGGTYNEDTDPYPLDTGNITLLKTLIYEERLAIDKSTKPEINANTPEINVTHPPILKQPIPQQ